ncbi:transposase family protein [Vibrio cholerae]|nr:transposase family protein [Vibrio cholerae]
MILLTICAVLSGQDDWKSIHLYGTRWLDFLKRFGDFSHGVPSSIIIARVMGMISATRLQLSLTTIRRLNVTRHHKSHASLLVPQRQQDSAIITNVSASSAK